MLAYLETDIAAAETACSKCPYQLKGEEDKCKDGKGRPICKLGPIEQMFSEPFREWVANLTRIHGWVKAGYRLSPNELSYEEWDALAVITRWYEVKDIQASIPRAANEV